MSYVAAALYLCGVLVVALGVEDHHQSTGEPYRLTDYAVVALWPLVAIALFIYRLAGGWGGEPDGP